MQTNFADTPATAPDPGQARLRFGHLVGSVYRLWRKQVDDSFKAQGFSDATRMPLLVLYVTDKAMRQKDLAHALSLDTSSLVRVLACLRDAKLVEWESDPADRRTKCISLTPAGAKAAARILQKSLDIEQAILSDLTEEELRITRDTLQKIAHKFESLSSNENEAQ